MSNNILPEIIPEIDEPIYAGFWRRFGAFWLDFLFLMPWTLLSLYISNQGRLYILYTLVPSYLIFFLYHIYTVKRWGGTPGKLLTKIKIIRKNGQKAGWREAILRHAVQLGLGLLLMGPFISFHLNMSDEQFGSLSYIERSTLMMASIPITFKLLTWANNIWIWSEFIVLLCNKRKRALHDFVAGTVVIKKKYEALAEAQQGGTDR